MGAGEGGEFVCFDDMVVSCTVTTLYRTVSTVLSRIVVHCRVIPSINFAVTHTFIHPGGERESVRVKCVAQEHNAISPARAGAPTT